MAKHNVIIFTDEPEFARTLIEAWQSERNAPEFVAASYNDASRWPQFSSDLAILGPTVGSQASEIARFIPPACLVIQCVSSPQATPHLRVKHPNILHLPLRDDWVPLLLLLGGECLRRVESTALIRQVEYRATQCETEAVLGRYMKEMRHSMNNALTSMLGNAELLLFEPGQLSKQSMAQIKTIHSMAMRIHEIMQRFTLLAKEMQEAEHAAHAEAEEANEACAPRA